MRKQGINSRGKAVVGSVVNAPDVKKTAHEILEKLQWQGPLELEFIRSRETGRLYLFEINCRFPSWIMLSALAGCNLPVVLLREILEPGQRRPRAPEAGVSYIRHIHDFTVSMDDVNRLERHGGVNGSKAGVGRPVRPQTTTSDTVVAVTGISAFEEVLSGCGVSKALSLSGDVTRLLGLVYGPYDTGAFQADTFDAIHRLPNGDDSDELLTRLLNIKKHSGLSVIIPCVDFEIEKFVNLRDELTRHGIHTFLPSLKALHARAKKKLFTSKMRGQRGVLNIPGASVLNKKSSLNKAIETYGFPLVIKGETAGVLIAYNSDQVFAFVSEMRDDGHEVLLAQGFVRGDEFAYSAVCGPDHLVIHDVLIKKLCQTDKGKTWGAINIIHADLVAALRKFLRSIAWTGPVEIEMIRDVRDDNFTLIEVNPRFPAWISYTSELGVNLPLTALNSVLGRDAGSGSLNRDQVFMRSCKTLSVDSLDFATIATTGVLNYER
jgi:carbamoyl-phosphate synthase large subunit